MTYRDKFEEAKSKNIFLPQKILEENIVGVYGFFAVKEDENICFYIGKSTNVQRRLFKSGEGHVSQFLNGNYDSLVPKKMNELLKNSYKIKVKILKEVNYNATEFTIAAHKLALAELQEIVEYQKKGQCLDQLPEGVGDKEKKYWERNYGRN